MAGSMVAAIPRILDCAVCYLFHFCVSTILVLLQLWTEKKICRNASPHIIWGVREKIGFVCRNVMTHGHIFKSTLLSLHGGVLYLKHLPLTCAFKGSEVLILTDLNTASTCSICNKRVFRRYHINVTLQWFVYLLPCNEHFSYGRCVFTVSIFLKKLHGITEI
jgi:hypothetical protein